MIKLAEFVSSAISGTGLPLLILELPLEFPLELPLELPLEFPLELPLEFPLELPLAAARQFGCPTTTSARATEMLIVLSIVFVCFIVVWSNADTKEWRERFGKVVEKA